MGQPAACISFMQVCPMVDGIVPHVGGPIIGPGAVTVLVGELPAAQVGNMCTCVGPPATIVLGSATVLLEEMPAARMGDETDHGGAIVLGLPVVLIGE
ncbi:PAAR domain-containing protein [Blastopirellula sp. JC732]|uniref:PAAR domain-containing protein n=1 Tax=Blastopirellula sediminis TaxID=2894196 RepID=A0A9X1MMI0_9BACT|nr:PAAR domain-containing protein [Blastopirellula sediminis]MCC9606836.1 PAAR domain-containing protein [Blastopirellula sediminis]MCC9629868.1 PAAR domain-containing protein [Blastopirellula sediminis]